MCESRLRCPREQTLHRKIGFLDPPCFFFGFFVFKTRKDCRCLFRGKCEDGDKVTRLPY